MTRQPAPNAVIRAVVDYLPDHRGASLFAALTGSAAASLNTSPAVVPHSPTFHGWVRTQQQFTGAVAALGRARTVSPKSSTLNQQKTTEDTVASSLFRERMARGLG
jgi:hypothetical protein